MKKFFGWLPLLEDKNKSKSLNLLFPCLAIFWWNLSIIQFSSFLLSDQTPFTFSSGKSENNMNLVQFPKENFIPLPLSWNHTYIGKPLFVPSCYLHLLFIVPSKLLYKFTEVALDFPFKNWKIKVGKGEMQMFIKMKMKAQ